MKRNTVILTTILISFIFLTAFKCSKKETDKAVELVAKSPNGAVILATDTQQTTPKGARVNGKFAVSDAQLSMIDLGLAETFDNLRNEGFPYQDNYAHFEIYTPVYKCVLSPVMKIPAFMVRADNYDNTEYDIYPKERIGVIYAAEMVLTFGTESGQAAKMYLCPDLPVIKDGVKHGSEHQLLAQHPYDKARFPDIKQNDVWSYFNCTITHIDFGHPLLPRNNRCVNEVFGKEKITADAENFVIQNMQAQTGVIIKPVR